MSYPESGGEALRGQCLECYESSTHRIGGKWYCVKCAKVILAERRRFRQLLEKEICAIQEAQKIKDSMWKQGGLFALEQVLTAVGDE